MAENNSAEKRATPREMTYSVHPTAQFIEEYDRAVAYACSVWGERMETRLDDRLAEIVHVLSFFPETFPKAEYPGQHIRKVPFYGPMVLYYQVVLDEHLVWLVSLWDGRREGTPRL